MYLYLYKNFGGDFVLLDSANSINFAKFLEKFGPTTQNNWKKEPPPPNPRLFVILLLVYN